MHGNQVGTAPSGVHSECILYLLLYLFNSQSLFEYLTPLFVSPPLYTTVAEFALNKLVLSDICRFASVSQLIMLCQKSEQKYDLDFELLE